MSRMEIRGFVHPPLADDGLPAMPPMPHADWQLPKRVAGFRTEVPAFNGETLCTYARGYARTCCAALDVEIDVLRAERDSLKTRLDDLRGGAS